MTDNGERNRMTVIYHNPRCSKSRQTLALLAENDIEPEIVEYLRTPPTAAELGDILTKLGMKPAEILRRKETREAGIDPAALSDAQIIDAIVANPAIMERPIVVKGDQAVMGRPPENVLRLLQPTR
ncbi:MAG: arsenate reductase (glutaredoxin) [Rhodospirillales bacterium]